MRFIYTLFFYLIVPFILLRLWWRSMAAPAYAKRWAERFAFFPALTTDKKIVWLHCVSVGEFIAALPLIRELQKNTTIQLVVTTTTPTGSERVRAALGDSVFHVYAPYDLPDVLNRFFKCIKPSLLLIMETELWPNLLAKCVAENIPAILLNARMSERSARGYQRFAWLTTPMLKNLSLALVQNKTDAARLNQLGLPVQQTQVTGNIKFDISLGADLQQQAVELKKQWSRNGERIIWIAASTHQGEDEIILDAFAQLTHKNILLVLVPRHPERFVSVGQLCESRGYKLARRSGDWNATADIVLGDTMGELMLMYGASDIVFVGGSLVPNGGHNFIEPAVWQLPLLSGEHVFNFAEVSQLLQSAGAVKLIKNANELAQQVGVLLDKDERSFRGSSALQVANENRGALQKTLSVINSYLN